jgi:hypothetical protein
MCPHTRTETESELSPFDFANKITVHIVIKFAKLCIYKEWS